MNHNNESAVNPYNLYCKSLPLICTRYIIWIVWIITRVKFIDFFRDFLNNIIKIIDT